MPAGTRGRCCGVANLRGVAVAGAGAGCSATAAREVVASGSTVAVFVAASSANSNSRPKDANTLLALWAPSPDRIPDGSHRAALRSTRNRVQEHKQA
jgi:hypothetical protein